MAERKVSEVLEREHRDIDAGFEAFVTGSGEPDERSPRLREAMDLLRRHIYAEEEIVFPPLRAGGLMAPVFVMLREHAEMWQTLDALDAALSGADAPESLVKLGNELLAQTARHNEKEEPILYPQADAALAGQPAAQLTDFLASGRMPDGWVCERARS